jgi:hypothetical protein
MPTYRSIQGFVVVYTLLESTSTLSAVIAELEVVDAVRCTGVGFVEELVGRHIVTDGFVVPAWHDELFVTPVPASDVVCVPAESVTASAPVRVPVVLGLKATPIVHDAPAASVVPQPLLLTTKSPLAATLAMLSAAAVPLYKVAFCAELVVPTTCDPHVRLVGERLTTVAAPVPVNDVLCVPAESETVSVPVRVPAAVGLKATLMVHDAPAARLDVQVLLVMTKSPLTATPETVTAAAVPFFRVAFCAALVVPTSWLAKVRLVGASVTDPEVT